MIEITQKEWKDNLFTNFYSRDAWEFRGRDYPEEWIGRRNLLVAAKQGVELMAEGVHFIITGENELTRNYIRINWDGLEVDFKDNNTIVAYLETWFDVDKKFGTNTLKNESEWINLYAKLDVPNNSLTLDYIISSDDKSEEFPYIPTTNERELIIEMIKDSCLNEYGKTLEEFIKN